MSEDDRRLWDSRHRRSFPTPVIEPPPPPPLFAHVESRFPSEGKVLELACGRGEGAVWLASRGLSYHGLDVSPVAIDRARRFVSAYGYDDRCTFQIWDLDGGIPEGDPKELLFCHMFRPVDLYADLIQRLRPGGLLAVAALSEVGGERGDFRCRPGELRQALGHLEVLDEGEGAGIARIVARKPTSLSH